MRSAKPTANFNSTRKTKQRNQKKPGVLKGLVFCFSHRRISLVNLQSNKKYKNVCVHRTKYSFSKALKVYSPAGELLKAMPLTIRQWQAYFENIQYKSTFYDITRFLVSPPEGSLNICIYDDSF